MNVWDGLVLVGSRVIGNPLSTVVATTSSTDGRTWFLVIHARRGRSLELARSALDSVCDADLGADDAHHTQDAS